MSKPNPVIAVMLGKSKKPAKASGAAEPGGEEGEEPSAPSQVEQDAAAAVRDAIKGGDDAQLAQALKDFYACCEGGDS